MSTKTAKATSATTTRKPKVSKTANSGSETKKSIYYVVYVPTYVNDIEILARGVYRTTSRIERLDESSPKYVRSFVEVVPDKIVHELAETLRVNLTDKSGNYRPSSELLETIVKDI